MSDLKGCHVAPSGPCSLLVQCVSVDLRRASKTTDSPVNPPDVDVVFGSFLKIGEFPSLTRLAALACLAGGLQFHLQVDQELFARRKSKLDAIDLNQPVLLLGELAVEGADLEDPFHVGALADHPHVLAQKVSVSRLGIDKPTKEFFSFSWVSMCRSGKHNVVVERDRL